MKVKRGGVDRTRGGTPGLVPCDGRGTSRWRCSPCLEAVVSAPPPHADCVSV